MARVHEVKKAQRGYPEYGIKKGEPYYWWKFPYGSKLYSKTYPKPAQLTQSDFLQNVYGIDEGLKGLVADDTIESQVETIADEIESLADEQEEKHDNMPDSLQDGFTGELLSGRAESCREWAEGLRAIDFSVDDGLAKEAKEERLAEIISEAQDCTYEGE